MAEVSHACWEDVGHQVPERHQDQMTATTAVSARSASGNLDSLSDVPLTGR
jgi:hypothetical protein